jgi:hypothetical protein
MKEYKNIRPSAWAVCLVCVVGLWGCTYQLTDEDWTKNGNVRLLLDWRGRSHPSQMTYFFYKEDVMRPEIRMGGAEGYAGTLPSGCYRVIACNTDCRNVTLEMDRGYDAAIGSVRQVSSLKSSVPVPLAQPANFYATGTVDIEVGGRTAVVKELYPANLVKTLELNIQLLSGSNNEMVRPTGLSGRLMGIPSEIHLPSATPFFDRGAYLTFEPEALPSGGYTSRIGLSDSTSVDLYLTMKMPDGTELTPFIDLTHEAADAFRKNNTSWLILDLVVDCDAVGGAQITDTEWKEGAGEVEN